MKLETIKLIQQHLANRSFEFTESEHGLELEHTMTDKDKTELVHAEYGKTLSAPVDELFVTIMKRVVRLSIDRFKQETREFEELTKDKLSEL